MIDNTSLIELIEQQISKTVEQHVTFLLSDEIWLKDLEQRIVEYAQARISAKFANVNDIPGLIETVQTGIQGFFQENRIPHLESYVDVDKIKQSIDGAVQDLVSVTIDNLVVDRDWLTKIEKLVAQQMSARVAQQLANIDVNQVIVEQIDSGIERWQARLLKDFKTNGIHDTASSQQLTVMDDAVVATTGIATPTLLVEKDAEISGTLKVKDLAVIGSINTDNRSWQQLVAQVSDKVMSQTTEAWQQQLVQDVMDLAKTQGIEFSSVLLGNHKLVDGDMLNPNITRSNLQAVGILKDLEVTGHAKVNDTLSVSSKRVGINTDTPEMALSVWDEEVSLVAGKIKKDIGYLGTSRLQSLALGVNRTPCIEIDVDGLTTVKKLRIDRFRIGFEPVVPGYSGTRGDIIINSDPKPDQPFAWQCLGGYRWQPIKGA